MKIFLKIFIFNSFLLFSSCNSNAIKDAAKEDKTLQFLNDLNNKDLDGAGKRKVLDTAYKAASNIDNDSLRNKALVEISYQYLKLNDSLNFRNTNSEARKLSLALNDSSSIAATYWDLAGFYHSNNIEDSAYYFYHQAQKIYFSINDKYNSARMLLNMSIIQNNIKDYTGSEITTTKAISLLKPLKKYKHLYRAYNNLGIVFNELGEYDRALFYYGKGLDYLEKAERTDLLPSIWNNIGIVYNNQKQYQEAAEYYNNALDYDENLENSDPELYAMLLDNRAYNKLQMGAPTGVLQQFKKALGIRKRINDIPGIIINNLHLAEYCLEERDTASAVQYASRARELSIKSQNARDLLASLLVLSKAVKDSALVYSQKYIRISDSLQQRERTTRNKFARIRFETDEYISQAERLTQKITFVSLTALGAITIFSLLYIIKHQRSRNIKLQLIEEGREKEKQRISRELHDGILGKLFGVRISLDSLNEDDNKEIKEKRFGYIEEIGNIAEEIRLLSRKLDKTFPIDADYNMLFKDLIEKQNQGNIKFTLEINHIVKWNKVKDDIKINIYRILQEVVHNIQKHSLATEAHVHIRKIKNLLILKVKDNGKGFIYEEVDKGLGLKNMESRVKNIHGRLEIISGNPEDQGTLIRVIVRIHQEAK